MSGLQQLPTPVTVQITGGAMLQSTTYFPSLEWQADGAKFIDTFRVLDLASCDGIVGLDWLCKYSPMVTHWTEGWLAFQHEGR